MTQQRLDLGGKFANQFVRQRVDHAELEGRGLGQDFADILINDAGADDADLGGSDLGAVDRAA